MRKKTRTESKERERDRSRERVENEMKPAMVDLKPGRPTTGKAYHADRSFEPKLVVTLKRRKSAARWRARWLELPLAVCSSWLA